MRHKQARTAIWVLAALVLAITPVRAQETPATSDVVKETPMVQAATTVVRTFDKPLHPVLASAAPGGGFAGGIGYDFPARGRWQTTAKAVVSVRRYWVAQFDTGYRSDRAQLDAYARMREMTQVDFFGAGTHSNRDDRTKFRLRDPVVGAVASVRIHPWVSVGGRLEELWPDVGRGRSSRVPSIEDRFGELDAPALMDQPRFGRYQAFLDISSPAGLGPTLHQGGQYRIAYSLFDDQQFDRFTFGRLDLEAQQKFELFGRYRRLTLHGWLSTTHAGQDNDVPFFLQHTLGGIGNLRSVGEHLIGSDGSEGTLRGFHDFRFRDRHLLLLQAEYRWPVWGPVDATFFVDAGKVTSRRAELDLSDLKRNYGFSLSVMRGTGTVARMDVGLGGGEGAQLFFSLGRDILRSRAQR